MSIYDFSARLNTGEEQSLSAYRDKVLLIVNTASECGFTSQYAGLQALQDRFGPRGFTVLAFPCNQFGRQEPHSDAKIASFCERKFRTTFPLFAKIDVNGRHAHPLYTWLKSQKRGLLGRDIRWNFTKYLVDRDGTVLARFAPATKPERIAVEIEDLLADG